MDLWLIIMDKMAWPKYLVFGYTSRGHKLISETDIEFPIELVSLTDIPPQPTFKLGIYP